VEVKQFPRVILRGDEEAASHMSREGIRQLAILKNLMNFQNLKQDVRRVRFIDGSEIICRSVFGIDDVQIHVPGEWKLTTPIVPRFFAKVLTGEYYDEFFGEYIPIYSYFWVYFGSPEDVLSRRVEKDYIQPPLTKYNNNIVILEISNNFERTKEEVENGFGFHWTLDQVLTPFVKSAETDAPCLAEKSFMLEDDHAKDEDENYIKERWVSTNHYLIRGRRTWINVAGAWIAPPPCDLEDLPCPPDRFFCDTEKKIMVWYGSHEIFMVALIVRMDNLDIKNEIYDYTHNCVAASGSAIAADPYRTLTGTKEDIPINMMPDVESVTDTEISFYLSRILPFDRPGLVTIDWIDYEWGYTISAVGVEETKHWYWTEDGFEQKICALFDQTDLDGSIVDEDEDYSDSACPCNSITTQAECEACNEIMQDAGKYKRTVNVCNGYISLYDIKIFDELFEADTTYRNLGIWEGKIYNAHHCIWNAGAGRCYSHGTIGYNAARRTIGEQLEQKHTNGLSAFWNSNNVAYFFKEQNRHKCVGSANQIGKICTGSFGSTNCVRWGGPTQAEFCKCCWVCDWPAYLCAEDCPEGLGKCFELDMPGDDWLDIENDYVEVIVVGVSYKWHRNSNNDSYAEPLVRKFRIDEEIEFDATEIYKTYYLDDRATKDTQGMIIAGKGIDEEENKYWEVHREWINEDNITVRDNITEELFEKLDCEQWQLVEIGLI
jgi:hypothetical protein